MSEITSDESDDDQINHEDLASEEDDVEFDKEDTGTWGFKQISDVSNVDIGIGKVDEFLFQTMKTEINVISQRFLWRIDPNKDLLNEVSRLLLNSLMKTWRDACNLTLRPEDTPVSLMEIEAFISTLALLSFYQVAPTTFFNEAEAFSLSKGCNKIAFKRVLQGLKALSPYRNFYGRNA